MRVLVVSQYFRPEPFRINEVVDTLSSTDQNPTVLTGYPNYPEGKCYSGYNFLASSRSNENGIDVVRVPIVMRGSGNSFALALNYLSFVFSALVFGFFKLRNDNYDVVFCYAPSPILQALPALFFSWYFRVPFVLHVQDLWPQSLTDTGHVQNKLVLKFIEKIVGFIYRRCDRILISSKPFESDILKYNPSASIEYLPNSVDSSFLSCPKVVGPTTTDDSFNCVFAGNIGSAQSVDTILRAAEILKSYPNISIVVYGSGSQLFHMEEFKRKNALSNLKLMGRVPSKLMPGILSTASVLLVTLRDTEIFRATVPNKIQAYLAVGRPIIACMAGEGARIVTEAKAGFHAEAENPDELAKLILKIWSMSESQRSELGQNGQQYFRNNFEHNKLVTQLVCHFKDVIAQK